MTEQEEALTKIRAELEVIEAKINELLKKFGVDDEFLWDIHRHVFDMTFEEFKKESETCDGISDQSELF